MMRSMFSAVSGLRAHQLRMDVIGNNIANVNTVGFKASRVTFQEVFNQTLRGAGSPQAGMGGTNPQQVGLGMNVSSMDTFHVRGAVERTDFNTDMMINGDGFFIVSDDANFLNRSFTRAGSFSLDRDGNLVTPDGFRVLGYRADHRGVLEANLSGIVISRAQTVDARKTDQVGFEGNLNSQALSIGAANSRFSEILGVSGVYILSDPVDGDIGSRLSIAPGGEAYIARETTFEVFDQLGGMHRIRQVFVKSSEPGEPSTFAVESFYLHNDGTVSHFTGTENFMVSGDGTSIPFGENGRVPSTENPSFRFAIPADHTNGAGEFEFTVDFSRLTMFANQSTASATNIDGFKQGSLIDFSVASTGEISGFFDNGENRVIGRIALANFRNPAGLEKTGSNLFRITNNSGQAIIGAPGAGGFGSLNPGALEMSNTDLSREFTNMITTQRGFQANSRIITTSDEMLQEVVNMKR